MNFLYFYSPQTAPLSSYLVQMTKSFTSS